MHQKHANKKQNEYNDDEWIDVDTFDIECKQQSRYWRIVLIDTYGGYTCLNHLKLCTT